jgi:hypothetical protein
MPPPATAGRRCRLPPPVRAVSTSRPEVDAMKDLLFVAITVAFFLLSWLYVKACERL